MKYWEIDIWEYETEVEVEGEDKHCVVFSQRVDDEDLCRKVRTVLNPSRKPRKREKKGE